MSLRRLEKLQKNPRVRPNPVSPVLAKKKNLPILGKDNKSVCV